MSRILLVNNEQSTLNILAKLLKTEGFKVVSTKMTSEALELVHTEQFNLMISSSSRECDPDLELLRLARTQQPAMPVIVITEIGEDDRSAMVDDLKPFASIEKPLKVDKLLSIVQKAVDYNDAALAENVNLNLQLETCYQFENIVAESPAMRSVCDMISRVAATDIAILLYGEKGTNKIDIAKAAHDHSRRKNKTIVLVDCTASNVEAELLGAQGSGAGGVAGAMEKADGGTLFLGEVESLPPSVQEKLFRVLKERKVPGAGPKGNVAIDVRIVASTDEDLEKLVKQGAFNNDLYKSIRVILIRIPSLRDCREDIMPAFRQELQRRVGEGKVLPAIDREVVQVFEKYSWPGNITEMKNVVAYVLEKAKGSRITRDCLPGKLAAE